MAQQLSNGRNVSGSWAVTETLNAWYEPKDHSIAVCYEYIEEAIANPRRPIAADANTLILLPLSGHIRHDGTR